MLKIIENRKAIIMAIFVIINAIIVIGIAISGNSPDILKTAIMVAVVVTAILLIYNKHQKVVGLMGYAIGIFIVVAKFDQVTNLLHKLRHLPTNHFAKSHA